MNLHRLSSRAMSHTEQLLAALPALSNDSQMDIDDNNEASNDTNYAIMHQERSQHHQTSQYCPPSPQRIQSRSPLRIQLKRLALQIPDKPKHIAQVSEFKQVKTSLSL